MKNTLPGMPWILCVDDEPRVLEGLALTLRHSYNVATAPGGGEGLTVLQNRRDIAVVVSDMRMPGMNGAAFLALARTHHPDATRILLTGDRGQDCAIAAVNEGEIFRFLIKPCPPAKLLAAVEAAVRQHRVMTAPGRRAASRWRVLDLVLDARRQRVWRGSQEIPLSKLTYDLFATLVRRCGAVTSDEQLMNEVWPGLIVGPETVSQRVMLLRAALGDDSRAPRYIGRLRGRGYLLVPTAEPLDDDVADAPTVTLPPIPPGAIGLAARPAHAMLTLLEPMPGAADLARPDWASTHIFPDELFAGLLNAGGTEARTDDEQAQHRNPDPPRPAKRRPA